MSNLFSFPLARVDNLLERRGLCASGFLTWLFHIRQSRYILRYSFFSIFSKNPERLCNIIRQHEPFHALLNCRHRRLMLQQMSSWTICFQLLRVLHSLELSVFYTANNPCKQLVIRCLMLWELNTYLELYSFFTSMHFLPKVKKVSSEALPNKRSVIAERTSLQYMEFPCRAFLVKLFNFM